MCVCVCVFSEEAQYHQLLYSYATNKWVTGEAVSCVIGHNGSGCTSESENAEGAETVIV